MTETISRFASFAQDLCSCVEELPSKAGGAADLRRLRILLADIHAALLRLPEGFDESAPDPEGVSSEERRAIILRLKGLPFNHYREILDPFTDKEAVMGSLADDLADIYCDIQDGFEILKAGHPVGAAWQWRNQFQWHWGEHLTGAQRAIHSWFARCDEFDDD